MSVLDDARRDLERVKEMLSENDNQVSIHELNPTNPSYSLLSSIDTSPCLMPIKRHTPRPTDGIELRQIKTDFFKMQLFCEDVARINNELRDTVSLLEVSKSNQDRRIAELQIELEKLKKTYPHIHQSIEAMERRRSHSRDSFKSAKTVRRDADEFYEDPEEPRNRRESIIKTKITQDEYTNTPKLESIINTKHHRIVAQTPNNSDTSTMLTPKLHIKCVRDAELQAGEGSVSSFEKSVQDAETSTPTYTNADKSEQTLTSSGDDTRLDFGASTPSVEDVPKSTPKHETLLSELVHSVTKLRQDIESMKAQQSEDTAPLGASTPTPTEHVEFDELARSLGRLSHEIESLKLQRNTPSPSTMKDDLRDVLKQLFEENEHQQERESLQSHTPPTEYVVIDELARSVDKLSDEIESMKSGHNTPTSTKDELRDVIQQIFVENQRQAQASLQTRRIPSTESAAMEGLARSVGKLSGEIESMKSGRNTPSTSKDELRDLVKEIFEENELRRKSRESSDATFEFRHQSQSKLREPHVRVISPPKTYSAASSHSADSAQSSPWASPYPSSQARSNTQGGTNAYISQVRSAMKSRAEQIQRSSIKARGSRSLVSWRDSSPTPARRLDFATPRGKFIGHL